MQSLKVSGAVRHIYAIRRQRVKEVLYGLDMQKTIRTEKEWELLRKQRKLKG
jgi:hypothetical protein